MAMQAEGLLLLDKPKGQTSFSLVSTLRRLCKVQKIGHAGTLDPLATGVMVMLIGRSYTRLSNQFLAQEKEYLAQLRLGISTDTFDAEGRQLDFSDKIPTQQEIENALEKFQGTLMQTPPMFSAKKVQGKKLYNLARKGITIERAPVQVHLKTELLVYDYPHLTLKITCSKGTYVRALAHDLGTLLGCFAHLADLRRTRSGNFSIEQCIDWNTLTTPSFNIASALVELKSLLA
jgi:tRNA pseudouridine55 synthase